MADKPNFPNFEFKFPNFDKQFWERLNVPGIDASSLMESQRKNFDALVKANQKAAEGYQQLMSRQAEILGETMQSIQEASTALMKAEDGKTASKKNAEMMESAISRALTHMKELADLTIHANADAVRVIQDRAKESVTELRSLIDSLTNKKA